MSWFKQGLLSQLLKQGARQPVHGQAAVVLAGKEKTLINQLTFQTLVFHMTMVKQLTGRSRRVGIFRGILQQIHQQLF